MTGQMAALWLATISVASEWRFEANQKHDAHDLDELAFVHNITTTSTSFVKSVKDHSHAKHGSEIVCKTTLPVSTLEV